ncbi:myrosinase 1-like [Diprion similis]|uniref:myrosinase 1-like n=1 Tax=Diprion similis TaxID=362088 RepID=UPI001EF86614|nr:myrosinase 1-like [Diprion similis]
MKELLIIVISYTIVSHVCCCDFEYPTFPDGFKFGAAISSYQSEGAWNVSDKGVNDFDHWTHTCPECIGDRSNGDIACDSYHKYKEDVKLLRKIGFKFYRFSISWARILPSGLANNVSKDGIMYYKNFINELYMNGIEPLVTLYHFDHPQGLEDMGGWTNELMTQWFVDYANIIFTEFGPSVRIFITINEPSTLCTGYQATYVAPSKPLGDVGYYLCMHNVLKAHAMAYHLYDKKFRPSQHGLISIAIACDGYTLNENNDVVSAETYFEFTCGIMAHPIFIGDYPAIVKERLALVSKSQGYTVSRLPTFSPEWISYIKGTVDYFALNHYTSNLVSPDPDELHGIHNSDSGLLTNQHPSWPNSSSFWLRVYPDGFGNLLRKIKTDYNNPEIYVTENGFSDYGELQDYDRINYFRLYLKELIIAVTRDGCRISRYTVWSLLDNWQLAAGYAVSFGVVKVDFNSPNRERTLKLSAAWWADVIGTHTLQDVPSK